MSNTKRKQNVEEVQDGPHRMYLATISGSYRNFKKEIIDFESLKVLVPYTPSQEIAEMHIQGRYVERALRNHTDGEDKPFSKPESIRQVWIDDITETTGEISFIGKNIKELSQDEFQDLATMKDLRFIPLPSMGMGKRETAERAYVAYADKILKKTIKLHDPGFNFAKLPAITLNGDERIESAGKFTNDEMIEAEQKGRIVTLGQKDDPKQRFNIDELKQLADGKNIEYAEDVGFDDLYSQLFSAQ